MSDKPNPIFNALTIAGSDSGGGAGIQADLKAFSALGVYGSSIITALTAQNTKEVRGVFSVTPEFIRLQLAAVFDDIHISAVKTGMLGDSAVVAVVADFLKKQDIQLVVDPVMISKSGNALLQPEAIQTLISELLPLATLITPNLPEASAMLSQPEPQNIDEMKTVAEGIHAMGVENVLLKGGPLVGGDCPDILFDGNEFTEYQSSRIDTQNTHGTGCTLASAITAHLAQGETVKDAVAKAKDYITAAIMHADELNVGTGHGPVNHFHALW
jgi:hydroxymethylpyrimidine kinase/phosphomethylpyrimidine kinase